MDNNVIRSAQAILLCTGTLAIGAQANDQVILDEIQVTGFRLQAEQAVDLKRQSTRISEVVTQDDLGQLPDHNLGEALGRVPGVSTILDEGVGRYVTIRGMDPQFVKVTFDDLSISSIAVPWDGNMNATNLEAIPSGVIAKVEVVKSVTPDMDGDAIGGSVNATTRSAFDEDGVYLHVQAAGGKYTLDEVPTTDNGPTYRGDVTYSNVFGEHDQYGIVLNANYRKIETDFVKKLRTGWHELKDASGVASGVVAPREYWNYVYGDTTVRRGLTGKFELKPSSNIYAFISANYFDEMRDWDKSGFRVNTNNKENLAAGTFAGGYGMAQNNNIEYGTNGALTLSTGMDWTPTESGKLSAKGTHSKSTFIHRYPYVEYKTGNVLGGSYSLSQNGGSYDLDSASDATVENPSSYTFAQYQNIDERYEKLIDEARLDWSDNIDENAKGFGYKIGSKFRGTSYDAHKGKLTLTKYTGSTALPSALSSSDYTAPGMTNNFMFADADAFQAWLRENGDAAFTKTEITNGSDYSVKENVKAGYAMGVYTGNRYHLVFGGRYERTNWESSSRINSNNDAALVRNSGDYGHFLPSIHLNFDLLPDTKLRLAYGKTIGRPDGDDLAAGTSSPDVDGNYKQSNQNLKPRLSNNADAAIEHYFDQGKSMVALGYFTKNIKDEIYTTTSFYSYTRADGSVNNAASISQPNNAGDAKVAGYEISLVKSSLDFLPSPLNDLGFQVNWTHLYGEMDLINSSGSVVRTVKRLANQPNDVFNAAMFYEKDDLSVRLAYKYTGAFQNAFDTTKDSTGYYDADQIWQEHKQFDLHVGYDLTKKWNVFADFWNITNENQLHTYGDSRLYEDVNYGRSVWIGLNYTN